MYNMMFAMSMVSRKVEDNLIIFLMSNFHGNRLIGLRVIVLAVGLQKCLFSGNFWIDPRSLPILTMIMVESPFGD